LNTGTTEVLLSVSEKAFSPNNDKVKDAIIFTPQIKTSSAIVEYKLSINDENGNSVKTFADKRAMPKSFTWNGTSDEGTLCENGNYTAKLYTLSKNGSESSVSTQSFWSGTIDTEGWHFFDKKDSRIIQFYQFFSFELKDSFEYLYVFYSKNQILLIPSVHQFEQKELKSISNDLPTLCEYSPKFDFSLLDNDYKLSFYKYKIEILKPISMYIEKNVDNTSFISLLKSSLISELFGRLQQYFSYPNIVLMDDNSNVKVLVASKKEINLELLKTHLLLNIENVIENFSEYMEISSEGMSKSFSDASSFLKVD
jgi:hypothetical protein